MSENQSQPTDEPSGLSDSHQSSSSEPDLNRLEEDLLAQTAEVVQQVRQQMADLARREAAFRSQQGQLDQDRRAFRFEQQQFEADTAKARESLAARRQELAVESDQLRQERAQLGADREAVAAEFRNLQADRARYRQELQAELQHERKELQDTLARAEVSRRELTQAQDDVAREREEFAESMTTARALLDEELKTRREEFETQLDVDREKMRAEVNEEALTDELRAERDQLERERQRLREDMYEWEERKSQSAAVIHKQQKALDEEKRRAEQELDELRRTVWDEIDSERTQHQHRLQCELKRATEEWQQSQTEARKQTALEESRIRFQQDHLQRLKEEVEVAQNQLRVEFQKSKQRLEDMLEIQRLRGRQLDRRRELYEQLERSLQRRQETVSKLHLSVQSHCQRERERIAAEKESWDLKSQSQSAENRRQADMLALHAENLEKRRIRLDALRAEIEGRHSDLLETQLAVDEAAAKLSAAAGDESAQERVEQARNQLSSFFDSLREGIASQQNDLRETRELLENQRQEFHTERQQLTEGFSRQEQQLRSREESLNAQLAQIEQQEADWHTARDAWIRERLEAEQIIRDLLTELAEAPERLESSPLPANLLNLPGIVGLSQKRSDAA